MEWNIFSEAILRPGSDAEFSSAESNTLNKVHERFGSAVLQVVSLAAVFGMSRNALFWGSVAWHPKNSGFFWPSPAGNFGIEATLDGFDSEVARNFYSCPEPNAYIIVMYFASSLTEMSIFLLLNFVQPEDFLVFLKVLNFFSWLVMPCSSLARLLRDLIHLLKLTSLTFKNLREVDL